MELHGSVGGHVDASPDAMFDLITDIDRLPEWNEHIDHIVARPSELTDGAEWVVEMRAMGTHWDSRSRVLELDRDRHRFVHRTQTDDGNPSYAIWTWELAPAGGGTDVSIRWELNPKTFFRKALAARMRHRQLKHEVATSIRAAEAAIRSRT
jgi:uncharacterized protein YndB with AHSA1/START domain